MKHQRAIRTAIDEINLKMAGLKIEPEEGPKADFDIGAAMKKRFRPPDSQVIEEADEEEGEPDAEDRTVYEVLKRHMENEEAKKQAMQQASNSPMLKLMLMHKMMSGMS